MRPFLHRFPAVGGLLLFVFLCIAPALTATSQPTPTPSPQIAVSLPTDTLDTTVPQPTVFLKPVTTTNIDGLGFVGFQGDFIFDETICTFSFPFVAPAGLTSNNWNVSANIMPIPIGPIRILRVSAFSKDLTPLSGSGTLYNLRMLRTGGTPGSSTLLSWQPFPGDFFFIDSELMTHDPTLINGLITITGPAATPSPTATQTPGTPTPTPTPAPVSVSLPIAALDTSVPAPTILLEPVTTSVIDAGLNYIGFQAEFSFDETVCTFSDPITVEQAGLTIDSSWYLTGSILPGPGPIRILRIIAFALSPPGPLAGSGTLFNLRMLRTSSTPGSSTPLQWQPIPVNFVFADGNFIPHNATQVDGLITIITSTPTPTPTPCTIIWSENFDELPPEPKGACWSISILSPDTPPNDAFCPDADVISDCSYDLPGITIPSSSPVLWFRNNFNAEFSSGTYWDGGVLEISSPNINGGAFTDVTAPAVGGSFATGGYNGHISTTSQNPLAGRMAWGGNSGGYIDTIVNLGPHLVGQTITLRFRFGSDEAVGAPGWRIDTLIITDGVCPTPSPTATAPPSVTPTPGSTPTPSPCKVVWSENFDSAPASTPPGFCWSISNANPDTPPNDAFVPDPDGVTDCPLDFNNITIPSASAILRFRNNFNTEFSKGTFWDGGVLEVSSPNISGGAFLDITDPQIGGSFIRGGYTGQISGLAGNPLALRTAWSGDSGGYIDTIISLGPNLAGQTISLRFRFGSDQAVGAPGWRIDTLNITDGGCPTPTPEPSPTPTPSAGAQTINLSTRMLVGTGENVGIGGFISIGDAPKQVLLRGIGPSLAIFGVPNALADPVMELHGPSGFSTVTNNNWRDTQEAQILATGLEPPNNLESAILATLIPGNYTVIVKGLNDGTGVGLVEIYDLSQYPASKLGNISTRAYVSTGADIMIAGFILGQNTGNGHVILRGIGPSLSNFGVSNALADPTLELRDPNGTLLASNDNWQDDAAQAAIIAAAGLALSDPNESGIVAALPPNQYTALLAGVGAGVGNGLVEVYNLGDSGPPVSSPTPPSGTPTPTPSGTPSPSPSPD